MDDEMFKKQNLYQGKGKRGSINILRYIDLGNLADSDTADAIKCLCCERVRATNKSHGGKGDD